MASLLGYKKGSAKASGRPKNAFSDGQVQNVKSAKVYVFGNDDVAEEDEHVEFEMPEMRSRGRGVGASFETSSMIVEETGPQDHFFEKEIQDGESLQAIALKYACPVSELKRINNLIQDQDFFALRIVKIPMKKHGILEEQVARGELGMDARDKQLSSHMNGATYSGRDYLRHLSEESDSQHDFSDPDTQIQVMRSLSIRDNFSKQGKEAEKFLKKMDADLKKLKFPSSGKERHGSSESLNEVISMLTNKSIHPLSMPHSRHSTTNGADCGLTFKNVVMTIIAVAVVVPIVALIYWNHNKPDES